MDRLLIHKDTYHDSVFLMAVSAQLAAEPGLTAAHVVLGTPANLVLLAEQGFDPRALDGAGPTDLIIALRCDEGAGDEVLDQAAERVQLLLSATRGASAGQGVAAPVGLAGGLEQLPGANLALISVPGQYAAHEAHRALEQGLNVMIFSDNVEPAEELALKQRARELGLLCMGPDCGTALVGGIPLAFANRVASGAVGLVGASGTGLQEVSCQIHQLGGGVTHILGTGGRDLAADVGAVTTLDALKLLAADPQTEVVVVVSKPPAREVADKVVARLAGLGKPSVVIFLGEARQAQAPVHVARTLSEAAWLAVALARGMQPEPIPEPDLGPVRALARQLRPGQRLVHGLFCGGTLAAEAVLLLRQAGLELESNLDAGHELPTEQGHTVVDLGDDRFTRGRPHPMIDPEQRNEYIVRLGGDPRTAALLLDLVLGTGSHPDPAGAAAAAIAEARQLNPTLVVLASITGTDLDAQGLAAQRQTLEQAGARVQAGNAAASMEAAALALAAAEEVKS